MMNVKTVNVKISRAELCDMLIACTEAYESTGSEKWKNLHDKLKKQLEEFDEKNGFGIFEQ